MPIEKKILKKNLKRLIEAFKINPNTTKIKNIIIRKRDILLTEM